MRCSLFFVTFFLCICLAASSLAPLAIAATKPTQSAPNKKPAPQQDKYKNEYIQLSKELDALLAAPKKNVNKKLWLRYEEKIEQFVKNCPDEKLKALARFDYAKCREELATRLKTAADYTQAAKRYGAFAARYPKHTLAPKALLQQATILGIKVNNKADALRVAKKIIAQYPKSKQRETAEDLVDTLSKATQGTAKQSSPVPELTSIVWQGTQEQGQLFIQLTERQEYHYQMVSANPLKKRPAQIHIDIPRAKRGKIKPKLTFTDSPVLQATTTEGAKGLQIILDVQSIKSYAVNRASNNRNTIVVDISTKVFHNASVTAGTEKLQRSGTTLAEQLGLSVKTIMLDAGHGGKDPGAMGNGITEQDFTLKMAKKVGELLKQKGFTVLYTRSTNEYITLQDRPDIANAKKADLFISIHVNASVDPAIHGLETYYLDIAQTHAAEKVAARENSVTVQKMSDLQFILSDFMLSSKLEESRDLARLTHAAILSKIKSAKMSMSNNGVRAAPFHVLMGAKMPAILVEFGYLSHADEAKNLMSPAFIDAQAQGLVAGIVAYKDKLAKYSAPAPKKNKPKKPVKRTKR